MSDKVRTRLGFGLTILVVALGIGYCEYQEQQCAGVLVRGTFTYECVGEP